MAFHGAQSADIAEVDAAERDRPPAVPTDQQAEPDDAHGPGLRVGRRREDRGYEEEIGTGAHRDGKFTPVVNGNGPHAARA